MKFALAFAVALIATPAAAQTERAASPIKPTALLFNGLILLSERVRRRQDPPARVDRHLRPQRLADRPDAGQRPLAHGAA